MKKKTTHKHILDFIRVIRQSFLDASIIYQYGGCYGFYKILKHQYPKTIAFFADKDEDHILSFIGGKFYDIKGEYYWSVKDIKKLSKRDHELWDSKVSDQRVEYMLAKYNRELKKHAEKI